MAWVGRINGLLSVTVAVGSRPEDVAPEDVAPEDVAIVAAMTLCQAARRTVLILLGGDSFIDSRSLKSTGSQLRSGRGVGQTGI